jgi:hypothetical protein
VNTDVGVALAALEARQQRTDDLEAIRAVMHRYARALDRGDWPMMRACFTHDATDNHGHLKGSVDTLVAGSREVMAQYWGIMHILGQIHIELAGDTAAVETYALSFHRRHAVDRPGDEDTVTGLRYLDRFMRTSDGWAIAERVSVHEWNTTIPARDWLDSGLWINGVSDRSDASYAVGMP